MTAQGDAEIARFEASVEAFNRGGAEAWRQFTAPDVVLVTAPGFLGGGRFEGDQAVAFLADFTDAWESVRYELIDPRMESGAVVHGARWVVTGRESHAPVTLESFAVARMDGERVASLVLFWEEAEALDHARSTRSA